MKKKKTHTIRTVSISNRKMVEREAKSIPRTQIYITKTTSQTSEYNNGKLPVTDKNITMMEGIIYGF